MFGWLLKIRSIQLEQFSKICVGSVSNCLRSHKVIGEPTWAPSYVVASLIDQNLDLAMELLVIWAKSKLQLDIQNYKFLKINIK